MDSVRQKQPEPLFSVLRAVPSQTMTGTLRWTLLIHESNSLFYRATVRSRDNMVETHKLFHMENSEWHFPHILHTNRALVRSSNFEESSSRPSRRGETKHMTTFTWDTRGGVIKQTTLPISYLAEFTETHTDKHTHKNTQTLTQTHKTILDGTRTRICTPRRTWQQSRSST